MKDSTHEGKDRRTNRESEVEVAMMASLPEGHGHRSRATVQVDFRDMGHEDGSG